MAAERMAVLGVYSNHPAADRAVGEFIAAGFQESEISAILPNKRGEAKVEQVKESRAKKYRCKVTDLTSKDSNDISTGKPHDVAPEIPRFRKLGGPELVSALRWEARWEFLPH
jgi:hypothetical protein